MFGKEEIGRLRARTRQLSDSEKKKIMAIPNLSNILNREEIRWRPEAGPTLKIR